MHHTPDQGTASAGRYRGADRRATERVDDDPRTNVDLRWTLGATGAAIVVLAIVVAVIATGSGAGALGHLARGAAVSLALVLALGARLHWRVSGAAAGYHLATAGWLIGVSMAAEAVGAHRTLAGALAVLLTQLLAAIWVCRAVLGAAIDTAGHVLRELLLAAAVGTAVWLLALGVVQLVPLSTDQVLFGGRLVTAAMWVLVGIACGVQVRRSATTLQWWLPGLAAGLGAAWLVRSANSMVADDLGALAVVLGLGGLLVGATGVYQELSDRAASRRIALHQAQHAQQRSHDHRSLAERERTHELRNALLAIEGATNTLKRHRDHLDGSQQERLEQALSNGVDHLHDLLLLLPDDATSGDATAVNVGEVVGQCAELARARGLTVHVDDRATTRARIRRVALVQIIDNLLANVERHACGRDGTSSTWVKVRSDAAEVRIEVTDDGPGLPDDGREQVFASGYRAGGCEQPGEGLGLPVARRLAREQGGDLQVRPTSRGACFELRLPVAVDDRPEVGDHGRQVGEPADLRTVDDNRSPARGVGAVVEHDGDLGRRGIDGAGGDCGIEADAAIGSRDAGGPGIDHGDDGDLVEDDTQRVVEQRRSGRHRHVRGRGPDGNHS